MRLSREEKTLLLPASVRQDRSRLESTFDLSSVDVRSLSCNNIIKCGCYMVHGRATQQTCFIQFNVYVSQSFSFDQIKYIKYIHVCSNVKALRFIISF